MTIGLQHPMQATGPWRSLAGRIWKRTSIHVARLAIVVGLLLAWQYLPTIGWLRDLSVAFDPFFVSSPERVFDRLIDLLTGWNGSTLIWPNLWNTLQATLLGVAIGTTTGAVMGLVFSNNPTLARTISPFIVVLNATPRIALIPIFIIVFGPTLTTNVVVASLIVFFLVFYNAFEGGRSVNVAVLQNARLLGGTSYEVMRRVRLPYVLVWSVAALPNAIAFGLLGSVTAEILTGRLGIGQLLITSIQNIDVDLTWAVIIILSVIGSVMVTVTQFTTGRLLHWWVGGKEA